MQDEDNLKELEEVVKEKGLEFYKISAVTGDGLEKLFNDIAELIKELPEESIIESDERMVYTLEEDEDEFIIEQEDENTFYVYGPAVERLMGRVNIGDNESYAYMEKMLKKIGITQALKDKGVKEGDTVKILEWEFEWYE